MKRFLVFCEFDGLAWDCAGRRTMLAYLAHLYAATTVSRETVTQYVPAISRGYDLHVTLQVAQSTRPGSSLIPSLLCKVFANGRPRRRRASDPNGSNPVGTHPPSLHLCCAGAGARRLTKRARGCCQRLVLYMISRLTMTAAMIWNDFMFQSNGRVAISLR